MSSAPLTFAALDGIAFAAGRGRLHELAPDIRYDAGRLGPFMEWRQLSYGGALPQTDKAAWLDLGAAAPFEAALRGAATVDRRARGFLPDD